MGKKKCSKKSKWEGAEKSESWKVTICMAEDAMFSIDFLFNLTTNLLKAFSYYTLQLAKSVVPSHTPLF